MIVPPGLDMESAGEVGSTRSSCLRVGYLGQLAPHKGVDLLVEAFQRLETSTGPELHIHGDQTAFPEYVEKLRTIVGNDPRISFHGPYLNNNAADLLSDLDVLVVPSRCYEIGPLVILEAFAARVPVVASRLPNMEHRVRDEVDGLLFRPDDIGDLSRQLQRLLDDPTLLEKLSDGIAPVRRFEDEMSELESIYESVAHPATSPTSVARFA
jgi:glycosyltransferase involved in cell wall biosynthesis